MTPVALPSTETTVATPSPLRKLLAYQLHDVIRSRWAIAYASFFLVITDMLFRFGGGGEQVLLSLLNVVLLLIPLVCLVFGTMYLYSARDWIEMMLAQPVQRRDLFLSLYGGLAVPLAGGFALGVSLPFAWHGAAAYLPTLGQLVLVGGSLTAAFLALAFWLSVRFQDRVRGLGVALLLWLTLAVIYDGLLLLVASVFSAYPLETPMIVFGMLNPISLARVLLLLQLDVAALLGYTGAAFERFFGTGLGAGLSLSALLVWCGAPLWAAYRRFLQNDF